jgi:excisionase family DNA binding protein
MVSQSLPPRCERRTLGVEEHTARACEISSAPNPKLGVACDGKVASAGSELVGTTEAATLLGISPNRVRQLIAKGQLPAIRVGRTFVIRRAEVKRFAAEPPGRPRHPRRVPGKG